MLAFTFSSLAATVLSIGSPNVCCRLGKIYQTTSYNDIYYLAISSPERSAYNRVQRRMAPVLAFCDGRKIKPMLPAQDHKRIFENDEGPNTGGIMAYCPCPLLTQDQYNFVLKEVLEKSMRGFQMDGISYSGVLYAGLMLTPQGPKILEFNCRFGDPETEVILPSLESDLYEIMLSCCNGISSC